MNGGRVLVTGGARRVGASIARILTAAGWRVIIHFNGSTDEARALAADIGAGTIGADLADRDAVDALIPACADRFGPLAALVNNASSFRYDLPASFDWASFDASMKPNLEAPLRLSQAFAAALDGREGAIVNLLDYKVGALNPDFFSYTVAKSALAAATRMMALAFDGLVRVNGVAPGITLRSGKQTDESFARAWTAPPLGRSSTPDEIADAVLFLLTTRGINGQCLTIDGGEHLMQHKRDIAFR